MSIELSFFPHSIQSLWEKHTSPAQLYDIKETDALFFIWYQTTRPCIWSGQNKYLNHPAVNIHTQSLHFILFLCCFLKASVCFLLSICIHSSLIRLLDLWGGLSETWPRLWMLLKSASQSPEPCFTAILQRRGVCSPLQHFFSYITNDTKVHTCGTGLLSSESNSRSIHGFHRSCDSKHRRWCQQIDSTPFRQVM